MSTLKGTVYLVNQESTLFKLKAKSRAIEAGMQKFFDRAETAGIAAKDLAVWSINRIGVVYKSDTYNKFQDSMSVKVDGKFSIIKKRSKLMKIITELSEGSIEKRDSDRIGFYIATEFGINNISGTHMVGDNLYVGIRDIESVPQERFKDTLIEVKESDYLQAYTEALREREGESK